MGIFSDDKRELTCVFNSKNDTDTQTLGYLKASEKHLNAVDITKTTLTGTQWAELAERLDTPIKTLLNSENIDGNVEDFDENDCITILRENPDALDGAIVFTEGKAMQIKKPSNAKRFIGNDSAAISKPYNT